jgi:hypothetical protein
MLTTLIMSAGTWFVLNHFRVQYYDSAAEGPSADTSPYWTIVAIQDFLTWPIRAAAICVGALIVWKVVLFAASSVSKVLGK